jgi:2,4-didehydro-3-deoxy-L-rhamnonate hydrolase
MKICWFNENQLGVVRDGKVFDVTEILQQLDLPTYPHGKGDPVIAQLSKVQELALLVSNATAYNLQDVQLLSPVAKPGKIIGTPANYLNHVQEAEANMEVFTSRYQGSVREQGLFLKATSSLVGSDEGVSLRFPEQLTHHEIELGVVIGKQCNNISRDEAKDYIAGYAIALDMTVRGPQDRSFRKSVDSYAVLGPWLVSADEISNPDNLDISLSINGEVRQESNTQYMIIDIADQIAWASQYYTLWPGDIIMTGTCEGVGQVHPGDIMHCEISQIGSMDVCVR